MDINKQSDIAYTLLSTQSIVCPSTGMGRASRLQWCSGDQSSKKFSGTALELKRPPERRRAVSGGEIYKSKLSPWFSSSQRARRIWQNKRRSKHLPLWMHDVSMTTPLLSDWLSYHLFVAIQKYYSCFIFSYELLKISEHALCQVLFLWDSFVRHLVFIYQQSSGLKMLICRIWVSLLCTV